MLDPLDTNQDSLELPLYALDDQNEPEMEQPEMNDPKIDFSMAQAQTENEQSQNTLVSWTHIVKFHGVKFCPKNFKIEIEIQNFSRNTVSFTRDEWVGWRDLIGYFALLHISFWNCDSQRLIWSIKYC